jgi:phosphoenolpyruvate synthase/pyruvate phosphate dikinase
LAGRQLVGGKGASLSKLASLGAVVPPGFAITTAAYDRAARHIGIPTRTHGVSTEELHAIRQAIQDAALPAYLIDALGAAYRRLEVQTGGNQEVAVRSSATAEDSREHSFAGLHDTFLDVRGLEAFEVAVKACWASLWTERAVSYRRRTALASDDSTIAVVVQQMVRSDISFVVFTADPVSGRNDRLVINATWGLGESLVSGLVAPDHIVVGPNGEISDFIIGDKTVMIVPGAEGSGTREVPVPRMLRTMSTLRDDQIAVIAKQSRDLAAKLGFPADLEGGIADGQIHFFQARPITTLAGSEMEAAA